MARVNGKEEAEEAVKEEEAGRLLEGQGEETDRFDENCKSLKRNPTQRKSHHQQSTSSKESPKDSSGCPDYFNFGVRSYLHHFYESAGTHQPDLYEELSREDNFRYVVNPKKKRGCCQTSSSSIWWKAIVWGSVNLVVLGTIIIFVGYLVPKKESVVGQRDELQIIDRSALKFNANLDMCKVVGLILFCVGGVLLASALLFVPGTYSSSLGGSQEEAFGLIEATNLSPRIPTDVKVPVTEQMTRIQPQLE